MNKDNKTRRYNAMLNECSNYSDLEYLTIVCSSRSKYAANKAKLFLRYGDYASALKVADPIAYNVGLNDFS